MWKNGTKVHSYDSNRKSKLLKQEQTTKGQGASYLPVAAANQGAHKGDVVAMSDVVLLGSGDIGHLTYWLRFSRETRLVD